MNDTPVTPARPLSSRKQFLIAGLLIACLAAGAWLVHHFYFQRTRTPEGVKAQIFSYLKKQSTREDFKSAVNWDPADTAPVTTNASQNARAERRRARAIMNTGNEVSQQFRKLQAGATTYGEIYGLIGEQLTIADQMLTSTNPAMQRLALGQACDACGYALHDAVQGWLASRIAEAYLLPNLKLLETDNRSPINLDRTFRTVEDAFEGGDETNNLVRAYQTLIASSPDSRHLEQARFRLSRLLEQEGRDQEALQYLRQSGQTNNAWIQRRIAALELRVKRK